jgi:hypothetical protein
MITRKFTNTLRTLVAVAVVMVVAEAAFPATFTVENINDSGGGSLRWAINQANADSQRDLIAFDIPDSGPHTIQPLTALPLIENPVIIDGYYNQAEAIPATVTTPAVLQIVLDGSLCSGQTGLIIGSAANDCLIRGLQIQGFTNDGIGIQGNHNAIEGNHIWACALSGIFITGQDNTVGGVTPAQRNVVNKTNVGIGIFPGSTHNLIQGNYVGTDVCGLSDDDDMNFDEGEGVGIGGSHNTVVGNLISGYGLGTGMAILRWEGNPVPENNLVEGNKIGTNTYGDSKIPNGTGIWIADAVNTTVIGNLIAGNDGRGVIVANWPGYLSTGNAILQNSIFGNRGLGIDLGYDGVTENDSGDVDTGPNNLMNFPVLTSAKATPGKLIVKGTIDTQNPREVVLEFFANSAADATGYGEGEIFLGSDKLNAKGKFTATLPSVSPGMWISATATDGDGNTSEFAFCIEAEGAGGKK